MFLLWFTLILSYCFITEKYYRGLNEIRNIPEATSNLLAMSITGSTHYITHVQVSYIHCGSFKLSSRSLRGDSSLMIDNYVMRSLLRRTLVI